ncbi:MAG: DUF479 domain-containing protein [Gammaproteobacteria bacterium]|nr:DUF479 domain-containing protein [Gammaproteobacteria bacterium]
MNYLAHTLLSKKHNDYQVANLVADALKGRAWKDCSQSHKDGLIMHKAIDIFTDNSPHVKRAKDRLGSGYLKGVIIDITFDHFVSKHWETFVATDFESFVEQFYIESELQRKKLPSTAEKFIGKVIRYDFLHLYGEVEQLLHVFEKFNRRLSANILAKESATDYYPRIIEQYENIEQDFLTFFPTVIEMFIKRSQANTDEHYFIPPTQYLS